MRIVLQDYREDLLSLEDLEKIIPEGKKGKALNYGQAEGQVQIEETVWGIYVGRKNQYFIQYEEGSLSPSRFKTLSSELIVHLSENFTTNLTVDGIHEGNPDV